MAADKSQQNEMTVDELAKVWGSILLRSQGETEGIVMDSKNVNLIMRFLISEVEMLKAVQPKSNSMPSLSLPAKATFTGSEEVSGWIYKQGGSIKVIPFFFFL